MFKTISDALFTTAGFAVGFLAARLGIIDSQDQDPDAWLRRAIHGEPVARKIRTRKTYMGLSSQREIGPGEKETIVAMALVPFKPSELIPGDPGAFAITDIMIGRNFQHAGGTEIPTVSPLTADFDTLQTAQEVKITVINITKIPLTFRAVLHGIAIDD